MHRHVALSRDSLHGALLQDTVTGHHHRVLSQATHHRVTTQGTATGYCHRIPSQDTDTEHPSLEALPRISATDKCHRSLSRLNITVAYKQRHPG